MFDEPVETSSEDTSWQDVNGSSTEAPSSEETSSEETSSDESSSKEGSSEETSSDGTESEEDSTLPVSSEDTSSFPIVPIVPPTELPPGQVSGDGMEQIQTYFTEVRAHQQNMQLVANNLSVISMVGILLVGAVIGLAIMKLVRL